MAQRILPLVSLALFQAVVAAAQGPPCAEFRVNNTTTYDQIESAVSAAADGGLVVTWASNQAAGVFDVWARRLDFSGAPVGPEFQVNTYTTSRQGHPAVASGPSGGFVVVWDGRGGSDDVGIFGRRFDPAGVPQGAEFRVNTYTTGYQYSPSIGASGGEDFVVVWMSDGQDGLDAGVFGQRFSATGAPLGGEFQVNTYTTFDQFSPAVAVAPNGGFVVVWSGPMGGIYGRRYDATGAAQGPEFPVSTTGLNGRARVAYGASGDFVVVWESTPYGPNGIRGRRFDAAGTPQGADFQVSVQTMGPVVPDISADSAGGFVVAWESPSGYLTDSEIFGRRLSALGVPQAGDFRINSYTTGKQSRARVAALPNRGFAVTWVSQLQDGFQRGIYGSVECGRLYPVTPCRLVDTRNPPGPAGGPPLAANAERTFPVAGACGVPADATAVALNATVVGATDIGHLRFVAAGQPLPQSSSLNFVPGRTRANNATVSVGTDAQVMVRMDMPAGSTGTAHLVLDVFGYFKR